MYKMVQRVQTWLMEHYNGKDRFETIKEEDIDGIAGTGTVGSKTDRSSAN